MAIAINFHNAVEHTRIIQGADLGGMEDPRRDAVGSASISPSHIKVGDYLNDVDTIPEPYEPDLALAA